MKKLIDSLKRLFSYERNLETIWLISFQQWESQLYLTANIHDYAMIQQDPPTAVFPLKSPMVTHLQQLTNWSDRRISENFCHVDYEMALNSFEIFLSDFFLSRDSLSENLANSIHFPFGKKCQKYLSILNFFEIEK